MPQEKVKVVVEIQGGNVHAVYAGNFVEVVILDHDNPSVQEWTPEPLSGLHPLDFKAYDGGFPESWGVTMKTKTL